MHYVYLMEERATKKWYIGYSADLRQRVSDHQAGRGAQQTRRGSYRLIYYEAYLVREDALGRERFLKSGAGWKFLKKQLAAHVRA